MPRPRWPNRGCFRALPSSVVATKPTWTRWEAETSCPWPVVAGKGDRNHSAGVQEKVIDEIFPSISARLSRVPDVLAWLGKGSEKSHAQQERGLPDCLGTVRSRPGRQNSPVSGSISRATSARLGAARASEASRGPRRCVQPSLPASPDSGVLEVAQRGEQRVMVPTFRTGSDTNRRGRLADRRSERPRWRTTLGPGRSGHGYGSGLR